MTTYMQKTGVTKGEMTEIGYVPGVQFENKTMSSHVVKVKNNNTKSES